MSYQIAKYYSVFGFLFITLFLLRLSIELWFRWLINLYSSLSRSSSSGSGSSSESGSGSGSDSSDSEPEKVDNLPPRGYRVESLSPSPVPPPQKRYAFSVDVC